MESLLCDEKYWALASPFHDNGGQYQPSSKHTNMDPGIARCGRSGSFYTTKEDVEDSLKICLDKEKCYMPEPGFAENVELNDLALPRFRVIQWLIKSKSRLRLSYGTVFLAINYFDRFISICECQDWKDWMMELLSVGCLSIASKSFETFITSPSLHEIQMEGLDHTFSSRTIQQMELILLRALEWRISSVTPHTFVELLMWNLGDDMLLPHHLHEELNDRVNELLLLALSDTKIMEFRPSILAVSAMRYALGEMLTSSPDIHSTHIIIKFLDQDQKDNLTRCTKLLEERLMNHGFDANILSSPHSLFNCGPLSPVTVLSTHERADAYNEPSIFELEVTPSPNMRSNGKKRKAEEVSETSS